MFLEYLHDSLERADIGAAGPTLNGRQSVLADLCGRSNILQPHAYTYAGHPQLGRGRDYFLSMQEWFSFWRSHLPKSPAERPSSSVTTRMAYALVLTGEHVRHHLA